METKKWYKSIGILGTALFALSALILPALGQADLAAFLQGEQAGIMEWLSAAGSVAGSALAFYGRWRATTKITG